MEQGQHILASALPSGMASSAGFPGGGTASDDDLNGSSEFRGSPSAVDDMPLIPAEPSWLAIQASIVDRSGVAQEEDLTLFNKLKRGHNLAKAHQKQQHRGPYLSLGRGGVLG